MAQRKVVVFVGVTHSIANVRDFPNGVLWLDPVSVKLRDQLIDDYDMDPEDVYHLISVDADFHARWSQYLLSQTKCTLADEAQLFLHHKTVKKSVTVRTLRNLIEELS